MADDRTTGSATAPAAPTAQAAPTEEKGSFSRRVTQWLRDLAGVRTDTAPSDEEETGATATAADAAQDASDQAGQTANKSDDADRLVLTKEELERRIQAEVDRRENERKAREARRRAQEEAEERKRRRRELRQQDPFEFARLDEEEERAQEQQQALAQALTNVTQQYDTAVILPLWEAVPETARTEIAKHVPDDPFEARSYLVKECLKAYRQAVEQELKASLRKSPTLRKELLAELRSELEAPEVIEGSEEGPPPADPDVLLRRLAGIF